MIDETKSNPVKKLAVSTMAGEDSPVLEFPPGWLDAPLKPQLIKQAVVYHRARLQQGMHSSQTRGAVTGTGRKAYSQKGTGRARMGSGKAPHRRSGGVAHGPHPRSHALKMNKKERKQILRAAIADRVQNKKLHLINEIDPTSHKTKQFALWLAKQQIMRVLIVVEAPSKNLLRASANLPNVGLIVPTRLNLEKLMRYPQMLVSRKAMEILQQRLVA